MNSTQKGAIALGVTSAVSLIVGATSGFFYAKSRLSSIYAEKASQEIAEAKKFYGALYKKPPYETPESVTELMIPVESAAAALVNYQGIADSETVKKEPVEKTEAVVREKVVDRNIFGDDRPPFDINAILRQRGKNKPFILNKDEFMAAEPGYNQSTLTFYEHDEVLADERDEVVDEVDSIVGEENLKMFGAMSADPNIVYIRNDILQQDYEILRSEGSYAVEVMGFEMTVPPHLRGAGG
jgi:hypothetical protein